MAEGVQGVAILGWSVDCNYIAVAEGTTETMNTVVYDVTNNMRMGSVDDAHSQPHHITWGPDNYLVVETRTGGILWHVPSNRRVTLTEAFNTVTVRNFSRLRWDAENGQLIANLAVGGRVVYDLVTGNEVPVAAQQTVSYPNADDFEHVVLGGRTYPCLGSYQLGYRNWFSASGPPSVFLDYDRTNQLMTLQLNDIYGEEETIVTLEDGFDASWVQLRSWSANCHYLAASLGIPGRDASDTVVYDAVSGRRVGQVEDARQILHPISWSTDGESLLVQTRNGGVLWYLPTNRQTIIVDAAQVPLTGVSNVANVWATAWSGSELFAVPVDRPDTVVAYEAQTGASRDILTLTHDIGQLSALGAGWMLAHLADTGEYNTDELVLFHNDSTYQLDLGIGTGSSAAISPDDHYLALSVSGPIIGVGIWDIQTSSLINIYDFRNYPDLSNFTFADNTTLRSISGVTLDVVSGIYEASQPSTDVVRNSLVGEDGYSPYVYWWSSPVNQCESASVYYDGERRSLIVEQPNGDERTLVSNLNDTDRVGWSPNCSVIYGNVSLLSDTELPYDGNPLDDIYRDDLSYTVAFWDAGTGEVLATFDRPYRFASPARVSWSPQGERALVRTTEGYFLFDPVTRERVLLTYMPSRYSSTSRINTYYRLYWDFSHGRLFTTAWGGVDVFDLNTGEQIALLSSGGGCDYGGCTFKRSDDARYLYVFGAGAITQYDFVSLQGVSVDVDNPGSVHSGKPTATSPDGRYLVTAWYSVRVWDLTNLAEAFDERDPVITFNGPEGRASQMEFIDNTTIRITTRTGLVSDWNIVTGQEV
ncbi:MAG: hypothetical protein CL607_00065 [Anaerolineaceae bacterium]|nr:hypothetical protein [Anaerolineaceae bacterium]